jgi:hypothetical protein
MVQVAASASTSTGVAPMYRMTFAEAAKVKSETTISSPGATFRSRRARCSPALPLDRAAASRAPTTAASSRSKASTCGPSGAIQFESKASRSRARSSGPMCGGER